MYTKACCVHDWSTLEDNVCSNTFARQSRSNDAFKWEVYPLIGLEKRSSNNFQKYYITRVLAIPPFFRDRTLNRSVDWDISGEMEWEIKKDKEFLWTKKLLYLYINILYKLYNYIIIILTSYMYEHLYIIYIIGNICYFFDAKWWGID